MNKNRPLIRDFYANTEQIAERFSVSPAIIKKWINIMDEKAWLRNAQEIGDYIGVSKGSIKKLVEKENLPAKIFYRKWRALKNDLNEWVKKKMRI